MTFFTPFMQVFDRRVWDWAQILADQETVWQKQQIDWYGEEHQEVEIAAGKAVWYTPRRKPLPIRWVLVRDPLGELLPAAFVATDQALSTKAAGVLYFRNLCCMV